MKHLLDNVTVIDTATFLAGPGAATILADFGARVIKIEPPGGDGYRTLAAGHAIPYHLLLTSRNKKSLALDLSKDAGQKLIHQLIAKADVLTCNFSSRQLKRYQLEYETLKAINPRLVYAHVSGYGLEGEEADRRAFDFTAWWARSGLMEFIRDPGQKPLAGAPGMGDHATATALFGAIMAGLYRRELTGEGSLVSTSLAANGVWANGMALQGVVAGVNLGRHRQKNGWRNPLTDCYACADGNYLVLGAVNAEREFPKLVSALCCEQLLADERFASLAAMRRNRYAFRDAIQEAFLQFSSEQIEQRLDAAGVTYGRVQPMADVLQDEQLRANGIVLETGDEDGGYELTFNSPITIREEPKKPPTRAPDVGQDSLEVLRELEFEEGYIQELFRSKTVLPGSVHTGSDTT